MAASGTGEHAEAQRTAVSALHHAIRAVQLHPGNDGLLQRVLQRCSEALRAATAHGPLTIGLRPGALHVGGEPVVVLTANEPPFALLRSAGVGELALVPPLPPGAVERLVRRLARIPRDAHPEREVQQLVADPGLTWLRLLAGRHDAEAFAPATGDWSLLPPVPPPPAALQALVARDLASNLPAMAAQQVLDDLAPDAGDDSGLLLPLAARLLDRGDLATTSWLLAEVGHHPLVGAEHRDGLRELATRRADDTWLRHHLEHGTRDDLMNVAAFAMQLGDDVAARFAGLLTEAAHPFSRWLCDLLRQ